MPAASPETSAPSLEEILWRAMRRSRERPALIDALEFADHIARAFDSFVPEEAFADRLVAATEAFHRPARTFADAVVQASDRRLHVYEFDLDRLEYVIVEDEDRLVVVSPFGQFAVEGTRTVTRAIERAAVVAGREPVPQPRAYFIRRGGEVLGVDAAAVARALDGAAVRQVSIPKVERPAARLTRFRPRRRALSPERERRALLQEPLLAAPFPGGAQEAVEGETAPEPASVVALTIGDVVVIVSSAPRGTAGDRALLQARALTAVREGGAPVATLALRSLGVDAGAGVARAGAMPFWVDPDETLAAPTAVAEQTLVLEPLQVGQITGDPWNDWELAVGSAPPGNVEREGGGAIAQTIGAPYRAALGARSEPAIAYRRLDGSIVMPGRGGGAIVRPSIVRPALAGDRIGAAPIRIPTRPVLRSVAPSLFFRSAGHMSIATALPRAAVQSLQLGLDCTAGFAAWRLPPARMFRLPRAPSASPISGRALRSLATTAGIAQTGDALGFAEQAATLVASLPFAAPSELHVGQALSDALDGWLAGSIVPRMASLSWPRRATAALGPAQFADARAPQGAAVFAGTVPPGAAARPTFAALPTLLRRAVVQSGAWSEPPAAAIAVPVALEAPETQAQVANGAEEIVISPPLWAQMSRAAVLTSSAPPDGGPGAMPQRAPVAQGLPESIATTAVVAGAQPAPAGRPSTSIGRDALFEPAAVASPASTAAVEARRALRVGAPIAASDRAIVGSAAAQGSAVRTASVPRPDASREPIGGRLVPSVQAATPARRPASIAPQGEPTVSRGAVEVYGALGEAPAVTNAAVPAPRPLPLRFRYMVAPLRGAPRAGAVIAAPVIPASPEALAALGAGSAAAGSATALWGILATPPADAGPVARPSAPAPFAAPASTAAAPPAYIATNSAGAAGAVPATTARRARPDSVEMSIVAAIPPAPPPLETMASPGVAAEAPRARRAAAKGAEGQSKRLDDGISHSRIEGSVDAIAQRIYHRIRRRLQTDHERFGG